jgi:hypothetical protein
MDGVLGGSGLNVSMSNTSIWPDRPKAACRRIYRIHKERRARWWAHPCHDGELANPLYELEAKFSSKLWATVQNAALASVNGMGSPNTSSSTKFR